MRSMFQGKRYLYEYLNYLTIIKNSHDISELIQITKRQKNSLVSFETMGGSQEGVKVKTRVDWRINKIFLCDTIKL